MIKICVQPSFQDWILVMSVVTDVKVNLNEAFLLLEQNMKVSVTLVLFICLDYYRKSTKTNNELAGNGGY